MVPNRSGKRGDESGDTNMDVSGYTDMSLVHSYTSKDMVASATPDLEPLNELD